MHNPLALLSREILEGLIESGHRYFVRQSYPRGKSPFDGKTKESFLITPYRGFSDVNPHFQAIKFDARKYVYQIDYPEELKKLYAAAGQPDGYKIYVSLLRERRWRPSITLAPKIKSYLRANSKWKPDRNEEVRVSLFIQFGELFLTLQYRTQEIKVPLSDIDKT